MKIVYTYLDEDVPDMPGQHELVALWQKSWQKHGFDARVLTVRNAYQHPFAMPFIKKVSAYPTINAPKYELACYMRWLALAVVGGGTLTDYDVMNRRMVGDVPRRPVTMFDPTYVPCAVQTTGSGAQVILEMLMSYRVPAGEKHVSDMLIFKSRFDRKFFGQPIPLVKEFGDPGWDESPMIHFAAGKCTQFRSKAEAIRSAGFDA